MSRVLFENASLVDGTVAARREGYHLLVEGDRIREISDRPITAGGDDVRRIDLRGATLMPGLIDAHVHVKATTVNLARIGDVLPSYLFAGTARIMEAMLMRGFTTVRDAAGADRGLADAVEHGLMVGPRLFVSGLALSQTGGHADMRPLTRRAGVIACACQVCDEQIGRIADGVDECRRAARDELRKGAHQIKIMAGGGVASPSDPIQNTQYSVEEMTAIVEEARAWHTYVMAHAYTPASIQRAVRCGVRSIEHGNLLDAETAALMAQMGAFHVPTGITYVALERHGEEYGFPEVSRAKLREIVEVGQRAVEISRDAGVKIAHGSDLLGATHRYQADELLLKAEVLGAFGALRSATLVNAELLGRSGELGELAVGAKADLLVVRGNPLEDIACLTQDGEFLDLVMRDGIIFKDALA